MMTGGHFRVTLETLDGRRVLTAGSEREVALMAESVLRLHEDRPRTVGFYVDCQDRGAGRRIALYLTDVALEIEFA